MAYDIEILPDLSRTALVMLHSWLHDYEGESGRENRDMCFSDTEGCELAKSLGVSVQATGGALRHLVEEGLVWVEGTNVNGKKYKFLHLTEEGFLACGCPPYWPEDSE